MFDQLELLSQKYRLQHHLKNAMNPSDKSLDGLSSTFKNQTRLETEIRARLDENLVTEPNILVEDNSQNTLSSQMQDADLMKKKYFQRLYTIRNSKKMEQGQSETGDGLTNFKDGRSEALNALSDIKDNHLRSSKISSFDYYNNQEGQAQSEVNHSFL